MTKLPVPPCAVRALSHAPGSIIEDSYGKPYQVQPNGSVRRMFAKVSKKGGVR